MDQCALCVSGGSRHKDKNGFQRKAWHLRKNPIIKKTKQKIEGNHKVAHIWETNHYTWECPIWKSEPSNGSINVVDDLTHQVPNMSLGGVNMISSLTPAVTYWGWFVDS